MTATPMESAGHEPTETLGQNSAHLTRVCEIPHPSALDEWSAEEELVDDDQFESEVEIETENLYQLYVHDG